MSSDKNLEYKSSESHDSNSNTNSTISSPRSGLSIKRSKAESQQELIMPQSPPKFVSMNQLAEAAKAFYNMSLVHEITLDSEFKLEKYERPENSLEHCVKEMMHRAFWDILRSSLEADPPDYDPAFRLLSEVKQSLEGLVLPNQSILHKLIENLLDLDIAKSELDKTGRLSLEYYAGQVIDLMKKFCAPVRDHEVEQLRQCTDPIDAFRKAFILLEKMHMDMANFTIAQMRPYIRQQAVSYERTKFAHFLQAQQKLGFDGLVCTRLWIREAYDYLLNNNKIENGNVSDNPNSPGPTNVDATRFGVSLPNGTDESVPPTPNNILREAYLALLSWSNNREWPETMVMDRNRLVDLGFQLKLIVYLTSLVLVLCNYVASNLSQPNYVSTLADKSSATLCAIPTTSTSSALFSVPVRFNLPSDAMVKLKHAMCHDLSIVLHALSVDVNSEQIIDTFFDQLILTLECWYNHSCSMHPDQILLFQDPNHVPSTKSMAFVTDKAKCDLKNLIGALIRGEHSVYKLMDKRAMDFLRLALSSRPPDPLSLPPGFGILLDLTKENSVTSTSKTKEAVFATTNQKNSVPHGMKSGGLLSNVSRDKLYSENQKKSEFEILSLSALAGRLLQLFAHNRHVFGPHYAEIIQSILMPKTSSTQNEEDVHNGT